MKIIAKKKIRQNGTLTEVSIDLYDTDLNTGHIGYIYSDVKGRIGAYNAQMPHSRSAPTTPVKQRNNSLSDSGSAESVKSSLSDDSIFANQVNSRLGYPIGFDIFDWGEIVNTKLGIENQQTKRQQYLGKVSLKKTDLCYILSIFDVETEVTVEYTFESRKDLTVYPILKSIQSNTGSNVPDGFYFLFNEQQKKIQPVLSPQIHPSLISTRQDLQSDFATIYNLQLCLKNIFCNIEDFTYQEINADIKLSDNEFAKLICQKTGYVDDLKENYVALHKNYTKIGDVTVYTDVLSVKNVSGEFQLYYPLFIPGQQISNPGSSFSFNCSFLLNMSDFDDFISKQIHTVPYCQDTMKEELGISSDNLLSIKKIFLHLRLTEAIQLNTGKTLLIKNIGFFFKGESEQFVFSIKNPLSDSITDPEISEMSELSEAYKTFHDKILTAVSKLLAIYADSTENPNNQQYLSKVTALKKIALEHLIAKVADDLQFSGFDEASVKEFIKAVLPSLVSNIQNIDDFNLILNNLILCVKELSPTTADQLSDLKIIQTATTVDSNTTYTYKCSCPPLIAEDSAIEVPTKPSFMLRDQQIFSLDNVFNKVKNNEVQVSVMQKKPFELSKTVSADESSVLSFTQRKTALEIQKPAEGCSFGEVPLFTLRKEDEKATFIAKFKGSDDKSYSLSTNVTADVECLSVYKVKQPDGNDKDFKAIYEEMMLKLNATSKIEHLAYIAPAGVLEHAVSSVNIDEILDFIIFKRKASEGDDAGNTLCYEINEDNGDLLFIVRTTNQGGFVHGRSNDLQNEEYKKFHGITITQDQLAIYLLKQITPDSQNIDNDLNAFFVAFGKFFNVLISKKQPTSNIGKAIQTTIDNIKLITAIGGKSPIINTLQSNNPVDKKIKDLIRLINLELSKDYYDINKTLLLQINKFKDLFFNTLLVDGFDYTSDSGSTSVVHQKGLFPHFIKYFPDLFLQNGSFEKVFLSKFENDGHFFQTNRRGLLTFIKNNPAFWVKLKSMPFHLMYKAFDGRVFFNTDSKEIVFGAVEELNSFRLPIQNCPAKWFKDLSGNVATVNNSGTKMFVKHKDTVLLPDNFELQITAENLQVEDISDVQQIRDMQNSFVNSECFSSSSNATKSFIDIVKEEQMSFSAEFKQNSTLEQDLFELMLCKINQSADKYEKFFDSLCPSFRAIVDSIVQIGERNGEVDVGLSELIFKALNGFILTQAPQFIALYADYFFKETIGGCSVLTEEQQKELRKDIFTNQFTDGQCKDNEKSLMMEFFAKEYYAKMLLPLTDILKVVNYLLKKIEDEENHESLYNDVMCFIMNDNNLNATNFNTKQGNCLTILTQKIDLSLLAEINKNHLVRRKVNTLLTKLFDPVFLEKILPPMTLTCQDIQRRSKMIVLGRAVEICQSCAKQIEIFDCLDLNSEAWYKQFDDQDSAFTKAKNEYSKWNTARLVLLGHCQNTSTELYESYKTATAFQEGNDTYLSYICFYLFEKSELINDYIKNGLLDFDELKRIIKSNNLIKDDNSILEPYKEEPFTKTIEKDILLRSEVDVFVFAGTNTDGMNTQGIHKSSLRYTYKLSDCPKKEVAIKYLNETTITTALTKGMHRSKNQQHISSHDLKQKLQDLPIDFEKKCYLLDKALNVCCFDPALKLESGYKEASADWIARRLPQEELRKANSTVFDISLQDLYEEFKKAIRNWPTGKEIKPTYREFYEDVAHHCAKLLRVDAGLPAELVEYDADTKKHHKSNMSWQWRFAETIEQATEQFKKKSGEKLSSLMSDKFGECVVLIGESSLSLMLYYEPNGKHNDFLLINQAKTSVASFLASDFNVNVKKYCLKNDYIEQFSTMSWDDFKPIAKDGFLPELTVNKGSYQPLGDWRERLSLFMSFLNEGVKVSSLAELVEELLQDDTAIAMQKAKLLNALSPLFFRYFGLGVLKTTSTSVIDVALTTELEVMQSTIIQQYDIEKNSAFWGSSDTTTIKKIIEDLRDFLSQIDFNKQKDLLNNLLYKSLLELFFKIFETIFLQYKEGALVFLSNSKDFSEHIATLSFIKELNSTYFKLKLAMIDGVDGSSAKCLADVNDDLKLSFNFTTGLPGASASDRLKALEVASIKKIVSETLDTSSNPKAWSLNYAQSMISCFDVFFEQISDKDTLNVFLEAFSKLNEDNNLLFFLEVLFDRCLCNVDQDERESFERVLYALSSKAQINGEHLKAGSLLDERNVLIVNQLLCQIRLNRETFTIDSLIKIAKQFSMNKKGSYLSGNKKDRPLLYQRFVSVLDQYLPGFYVFQAIPERDLIIGLSNPSKFIDCFKELLKKQYSESDLSNDKSTKIKGYILKFLQVQKDLMLEGVGFDKKKGEPSFAYWYSLLQNVQKLIDTTDDFKGFVSNIMDEHFNKELEDMTKDLYIELFKQKREACFEGQKLLDNVSLKDRRLIEVDSPVWYIITNVVLGNGGTDDVASSIIIDYDVRKAICNLDVLSMEFDRGCENFATDIQKKESICVSEFKQSLVTETQIDSIYIKLQKAVESLRLFNSYRNNDNNLAQVVSDKSSYACKAFKTNNDVFIGFDLSVNSCIAKTIGNALNTLSVNSTIQGDDKYKNLRLLQAITKEAENCLLYKPFYDVVASSLAPQDQRGTIFNNNFDIYLKNIRNGWNAYTCVEKNFQDCFNWLNDGNKAPVISFYTFFEDINDIDKCNQNIDCLKRNLFLLEEPSKNFADIIQSGKATCEKSSIHYQPVVVSVFLQTLQSFICVINGDGFSNFLQLQDLEPIVLMQEGIEFTFKKDSNGCIELEKIARTGFNLPADTEVNFKSIVDRVNEQIKIQAKKFILLKQEKTLRKDLFTEERANVSAMNLESKQSAQNRMSAITQKLDEIATLKREANSAKKMYSSLCTKNDWLEDIGRGAFDRACNGINFNALVISTGWNGVNNPFLEKCETPASKVVRMGNVSKFLLDTIMSKNAEKFPRIYAATYCSNANTENTEKTFSLLYQERSIEEIATERTKNTVDLLKKDNSYIDDNYIKQVTKLLLSHHKAQLTYSRMANRLKEQLDGRKKKTTIQPANSADATNQSSEQSDFKGFRQIANALRSELASIVGLNSIKTTEEQIFLSCVNEFINAKPKKSEQDSIEKQIKAKELKEQYLYYRGMVEHLDKLRELAETLLSKGEIDIRKAILELELTQAQGSDKDKKPELFDPLKYEKQISDAAVGYVSYVYKTVDDYRDCDREESAKCAGKVVITGWSTFVRWFADLWNYWCGSVAEKAEIHLENKLEKSAMKTLSMFDDKKLREDSDAILEKIKTQSSTSIG